MIILVINDHQLSIVTNATIAYYQCRLPTINTIIVGCDPQISICDNGNVMFFLSNFDNSQKYEYQQPKYPVVFSVLFEEYICAWISCFVTCSVQISHKVGAG